MSEIKDRNGVLVEQDCSLTSAINPTGIQLDVVGIINGWIFVKQQFKGAAPWGILATEFPTTQYYVTKTPSEKKEAL